MRTVELLDSGARFVVSSLLPVGEDGAGEVVSRSRGSGGAVGDGAGEADGTAGAGVEVTRVTGVTTDCRMAGGKGRGEDVKTGRETFAGPAVASGGGGEVVVILCKLSFA